MNVLPEKCQNFRNLEGGGEAAAPSPPRPVHLCYLVKLGAGLLSEKKYNFCVLFCTFFIL